MVCLTVSSEAIDAHVRANLALLTSSMSPQSALLAWVDWMAHLATSPGKQLELGALALKHLADISSHLNAGLSAGMQPSNASPQTNQDSRFKGAEWCSFPFNIWRETFLLNQHWWQEATHGVVGVTPHHQNVAAFTVRQFLDLYSPSNYLLTNPVALRRTAEQMGANLLRGFGYLIDDGIRGLTGASHLDVNNFRVGHEVAATAGKVILRNSLIELIQYAPSTVQVKPEPILVVPAWIMKYYILDLSQTNSLIKYLVGKGYTVFCVSWKNPGEKERDFGMEDYLQLGFHAALSAINAVVPEQKVHVTGYCLGGTLSIIAAAGMARDNDERLGSLSLFTTQADFSEPGELSLFIDESQVALLEAQMAEKGYLRGDQMSGAFQMLRSYDLLWSKVVNEYILGERKSMNDLMAWNADVTRMPARMHSQYLRRLFLSDDLSEGRFPVAGRPVSLGDINLPVFCVGTEDDHVAPWHSVYKLHYLSPAEITFVLASGGHNAGIVSEPDHPRRKYRVHVRRKGDGYVDADAWLESAERKQGSWWPEWVEWLDSHSSELVAPPGLGAEEKGYFVLCDAPGEYVKET